jgi:hypothetical protein
VCLAPSLRDRTERDVYVASAWHPDSEWGPRVGRLRKLKRPEGRAPARIIVAALNTYPVILSAVRFSDRSAGKMPVSVYRSADFPAFASGFGAVASKRSGDGQSALSPICNRQGTGASQVSRFC